jgi:hypothetical protein
MALASNDWVVIRWEALLWLCLFCSVYLFGGYLECGESFWLGSSQIIIQFTPSCSRPLILWLALSILQYDTQAHDLALLSSIAS